MKQKLLEINIMRPICIISIILGHSFAIYSGAWPNSNIPNIDLYRHVNPIFISFQLSAFAFISGYLFEHSYPKIRKIKFIEFSRKKFQRLMLPAIILGLIYIFLFERDKLSFIYLFSGPGHLWFLPMIFWGYIFLFILKSTIYKNHVPFVHLLLISCITLPLVKLGIPLGISNSLYYLPYLLWGCYIYAKRNVLSRKQHVRLSYIDFIIYLVLMLCILNIQNKTIVFGIKYICNFVGTTWLWHICFLLKDKGDNSLWNILCNKSYGLYLFHQFILIFLYYDCSWLLYVNKYTIPFVCFIFSLGISWGIVYLLQKTFVNKYIS